MAFAVAITKTQIPYISTDCIYSFSKAKTYNYGVNRNQTYSIFVSRDLEKSADFSIAKKIVFVANVDALYDANLYKFFGKSNNSIWTKD